MPAGWPGAGASPPALRDSASGMLPSPGRCPAQRSDLHGGSFRPRTLSFGQGAGQRCAGAGRRPRRWRSGQRRRLRILHAPVPASPSQHDRAETGKGPSKPRPSCTPTCRRLCGRQPPRHARRPLHRRLVRRDGPAGASAAQEGHEAHQPCRRVMRRHGAGQGGSAGRTSLQEFLAFLLPQAYVLQARESAWTRESLPLEVP